MSEEESAFDKIKAVLKSIRHGEIMSYGEVALRAGFPRGARTVVWVLKSNSETDALPWHRVVRKDHRIAIKNPEGHFLQWKLLEAEGWKVDESGLLHRKDEDSPQRGEEAKEFQKKKRYTDDF